MSFQTTAEHVNNIMGAAEVGNYGPFWNAIEPDVHWRIGSGGMQELTSTEIYNRESWAEKINNPLMARLKDGKLEMQPVSIQVNGNQVIVECTGKATQLNGRPYNNSYAWFLTFNDKGKISEIREYLDTALIREVLTTNEV